MASNATTVTHRCVESHFDKIVIAGVFHIKLTCNKEQQQVEILADEKIQEYIVAEVDANDQTLSIHMRDNSPSFQSKIILSINFPLLKRYTLNHGVGNTEGTNDIVQNEKLSVTSNESTHNLHLKMHVPALEATLSGTGKHTFVGQVDGETNITCKGVTNVDASNLISLKVNVDSSGVGQTKVQATEEINAHVSGVTSVLYRGPLNRPQQSGTGRIEPF